MLNKDQFADNHFIRTIIDEDLKSGKHTAIQTRFPPEPNGYLHIGHAKSICLNFGLAYIYDGLCNLRFDDTNPEKENDEYVNAIKEDVEWLGFHWAGEPRFASNYFDQLYDYAVGLIKDGKAYVDDLTPEEMREYRGTLTEAGKNSPYRDRSIEENLDLFTRMKNGEFPDGSKTLRLKIDMASGNINMRDPVIYRIRRAHHHNTGDNGVSTRCTTTRIAFPMPSKASRIPCVRSNLKHTARCTTGYWTTFLRLTPRVRANTSFPVWSFCIPLRPNAS